MDNSEKTYKLGEFAELMNVSKKSLQRWDKNGVLVADRTDGCHRSYSQKHIDKLQQLRIKNSSKLTRKKNYKYQDLKGMRFGKLYVDERVEDWIGANGHRHIQWKCLCDCGKEVVVKGSSLKNPAAVHSTVAERLSKCGLNIMRCHLMKRMKRLWQNRYLK